MSGAIELASLIRDADSVVALTGAGISVPSGIPDFRTPGTGLWTNIDPMEVAHIDVFRRDPQRFWHFYGDRFQALECTLPNRAHLALAALERVGLLEAVVTQNIDRLHARAGSRSLVEVHGTIDHSSCPYCTTRYPLPVVRQRPRRDGAGIPAPLPATTLAAGGKIAILTQGTTTFDADAAVKLSGDVVTELEAVLAALGLELDASLLGERSGA